MEIYPSMRFEQPALRQVSIKIAAVGGINLGQGVCRMPVPPVVLEAARQAISSGENLYCPASGIPALRQAIAKKLSAFNAADYGAERVLVTPGSTGAFEALCQAFLNRADHVVSFSPYYPYHHNAYLRKGVDVSYLELRPPHWEFDPEELGRLVREDTKFILVNTPNNPTGKVFTRQELSAIAEICIKRQVLCVTDEVYEYMTYDGAAHLSIASLPGMLERCVTIGSYSKTFAITGWRVGYLAGPLQLVDALTPFLDNIYVCAPTPLQHAVRKGIESLGDDFYAELREEYARKRVLMQRALDRAGLNPHTPQGAYYMLADIRGRFPGKSSEEVSDILIEKAKVGAVPASDFVGFEVKGNPVRSTFLRFCYAVPDDLLIATEKNLSAL